MIEIYPTCQTFPSPFCFVNSWWHPSVNEGFNFLPEKIINFQYYKTRFRDIEANYGGWIKRIWIVLWKWKSINGFWRLFEETSFGFLISIFLSVPFPATRHCSDKILSSRWYSESFFASSLILKSSTKYNRSSPNSCKVTLASDGLTFEKQPLPSFIV